MWNEINNENDLQDFMNKVECFHDSCIKEMKYLSGAYVDDDLSMYPISDKRVLNIIIQRQFEDIPMIEMQFMGLKCLKLFPIDEENTCEILDSKMLLKDNYIYWCDYGDIFENNCEDYEGTFVCASKLRWRIIENGMGQDQVYIAIK